MSANHIEIVQKAKNPRKWNVRSRLQLRPNSDDDRQQYSCRGLHPALKDSPTTLVASVILSVLHPPDPPLITGYPKGDILQEGEQRSLTCRVTGGNPRPWVLWYRHGRPLDPAVAVTLQSLRADATVSTKAPVSNVREEGSVSSVQQVVGSRHEDGAVYECRVTSPLLPRPLSTNVTLSVHYGPAWVEVTGPTVAAAGQQFAVTCRTSPSNPPATITWRLQGNRVTSGAQLIKEDEGGGWVTSSEMTYHLARSRKVSELTVECIAQDEKGDNIVSQTHVISIIKRPGWPVVEVEETEEGAEIAAGDTVNAVCVSEGGIPPPDVLMYKGDEKLPITVVYEGAVTRARAEVKVTAADNGAKVRCDVINPRRRSQSALTKVLVLNSRPGR
ncbi:synaptogenesis protein syg-2-like [Penaeus monodon]|uniref:synaptogenesis protein syg-2-like n=1 Tax=Penaeus monodon TaxID=6687 RepID=UPI0018A71C48|nr:synaptogenesis protein syg-2-like [Penaeus monodon]